MTSAGAATKSYRTIDLVTIATLGVAFGVIYWGWGKLYAVGMATSVFAFPPSAGLWGGGWLIAGVVGGLIIRKPGAALATEAVAATVSALVPGGTEWGVSVVLSGLLQGLGAEAVFALARYRRFSLTVAALAGALAAVPEAFYEWSYWYADWDLPFRLAHLAFFITSGVVIAGLGGWLLVRALGRAGVLDAFPAGREHAGEV
jgi:energy-coupling factor transport system substrate-specific component